MGILDFIMAWLIEVIIVAVLLVAIFLFIFLVSRVEKMARTTLHKAAEDKKLAENAIRAARDIAAMAGQPGLCAPLDELHKKLDGLFRRIFYLHTAIVKKTGFITARSNSKEIQLAGRQMSETAATVQQTSKDVIKNAQLARHNKTTGIIMQARSLVDDITALAKNARGVTAEPIIAASSFSEMAVELYENIESVIPELTAALKSLVDQAPTATTAQLAKELLSMEEAAKPAYKHWESLLTMRAFAQEEKDEAAQIILTAPALESAIKRLAETVAPYRSAHNQAIFQDIDRCVASAVWLAANIVQTTKARDIPQARQWLEQLYDIEEWLRKVCGNPAYWQ